MQWAILLLGLDDGSIPTDRCIMKVMPANSKSRMCVGYSFANQMLYIAIAKLLWSLTIEKMKDTEGKVIEPSRNEFIDTGIVWSVTLSPSYLLRLTIVFPTLQSASALQVQIYPAFSRCTFNS